MREAAEKLKNLYGSKGKMKLKLFISVKGIKLFDATTLVSSLYCPHVTYLSAFTGVIRHSEHIECILLHTGSKKP